MAALRKLLALLHLGYFSLQRELHIPLCCTLFILSFFSSEQLDHSKLLFSLLLLLRISPQRTAVSLLSTNIASNWMHIPEINNSIETEKSVQPCFKRCTYCMHCSFWVYIPASACTTPSQCAFMTTWRLSTVVLKACFVGIQLGRCPTLQNSPLVTDEGTNEMIRGLRQWHRLLSNLCYSSLMSSTFFPSKFL